MAFGGIIALNYVAVGLERGREWLQNMPDLNQLSRTSDSGISERDAGVKLKGPIHGYCRSQQNDNVVNAALGLAKALSGSSNKNGK
jgi:hypothetical protein